MTPDHGPLAQATAVRGYRDAKEVLNDASRFAQASKQESADFVGDTVLTLDGDSHFERRRLLSRLMRHRVLTRFEFEVIEPTVHRQLDASLAQSPELDLVRFSRRVFLRLAAAMIGLRIEDGDTDRVLEEHLYPLIEAVTVEWSQRPHQEVIAEGLRAMQSYVRGLVDPAILDRQERTAADPDLADAPPDLITLMLVENFNTEQIHREAVLFLVASTLNNAATLTHAIDETDRWIRSERLGREAIGADITQRIVNETLRFCVVTPAVFRRALSDTRLGSGLQVAEGDMVAVLLPDANRDEAVWGPEAGRFDPLRSIPEGEKPYGLAFGAGVHACLGRPLVLGSYSEELTAGMLNRILHELLRRGATTDRGRGVTYAASDQTRFETFPIRFGSSSGLAAALHV
jgi:cytochrome P450